MIASVILVLIVSLAACGGKADSGATDETTESNPVESSASINESKDSAIDASEEAKTDAEVDTTPVETQPETKPETKSETTQSAEKPASKPASHTHDWKEHHATKQVWVSNIVPVYETQKVQVGNNKISDGNFWHCNCGAVVSKKDADAHMIAHMEAGEPDNGYDQEHFHDGDPIYEERQVQVGTEDKSYWETESYVDYVYCSDCGAKK